MNAPRLPHPTAYLTQLNQREQSCFYVALFYTLGLKTSVQREDAETHCAKGGSHHLE